MYLTHITFRIDDYEFSLIVEHDWKPSRRADWNNPPEPPQIDRWKIESIDALVVYPLGGDYGFTVNLVVDDNYAGLLRDINRKLRAEYEAEVLEKVANSFEREMEGV